MLSPTPIPYGNHLIFLHGNSAKEVNVSVEKPITFSGRLVAVCYSDALDKTVMNS